MNPDKSATNQANTAQRTTFYEQNMKHTQNELLGPSVLHLNLHSLLTIYFPLMVGLSRFVSSSGTLHSYYE
jgi:hypothetical protein